MVNENDGTGYICSSYGVIHVMRFSSCRVSTVLTCTSFYIFKLSLHSLVYN